MRPAYGSYTPEALDVAWFQGFIGNGNPLDGRRFADHAPRIDTELIGGPGLHLLGTR
jgi:hypothetical protein